MRKRRSTKADAKNIKRIVCTIPPHLLLGFKYIWTSLIIFCLVNIVFHILLWPSSWDYLTLSADRWWAFTPSVFVHNDSAHLFSNLWVFIEFIAIFVIVNAYSGVEKKERWSKIFLYVIFVAGIAAGAIQLLAGHLAGRQVNIGGSSGIVYASIGVLFAFSLCTSLSYFSVLISRRVSFKNFQRFFDFLLSMAVLGFLFLSLSLNPRDFLGIAPKVGAYSHGYGFLLGIFGSLILFYLFTRKIKSQTSS